MTIMPWSSLAVGQSFTVPARIQRHDMATRVRQANSALSPKQFRYERPDELADWTVTRLEDADAR
jgi:hypothetical protein